MSLDQSTRQIGIETPLGSNVLALRNFTLTEELGRLFQIEAELVSENFQIDFSRIVGQNVTIRLETIQSGPRFFNGHVRMFRQAGNVARLARYQAVIVPKLWFLTRSADCRIFQNQKVPDIVKKVIRDHGISDIEDTLTANYRTWEYCVQYRETDFNFVCRLMEQEGMHFYFKHQNGKHTLVLADGDSTHTPFPGFAQVPFRSTGKPIVDLQAIQEWTLAQEVEPGSCTLNDYDFQSPRKSLVTTANVSRPNIESDHDIYDYPGEYTELSDGQQYCRERIQELQVDFENVFGQGDVRGIAAGRLFTLAEHPRNDQNREYLVVSTTIQAYSEGFEAAGGLTGSPGFSCSFSAMSSKEPFRPARITPKPIIQGAQTAVVTGKKGEEITTDDFGRVKVQFYWDRQGKHDENTTCFIRVATLWAGRRWGSTFTPRIGQEVVVNFLEGDPDHPLIIGSVYNGDQKLPYLGNGLDPNHSNDPKVCGVKSCSTKGGDGFNELRFDDTKGKEQIFIHGEKDLDLRVKADSRLTGGGYLHLLIGSQTGDAVGDMRARVGRNINLNARHFIRFQGDDGYDLQIGTGDQNVEVRQGGILAAVVRDQITYKSNQIVLEAGEICLNAGPSFIRLGPDGIYLSGPMIYLNSGGAALSAQNPTFIPHKDISAADDSKSGSPSN
jgi:type VI secretion system secreted protein VgrG